MYLLPEMLLSTTSPALISATALALLQSHVAAVLGAVLPVLRVDLLPVTPLAERPGDVNHSVLRDPHSCASGATPLVHDGTERGMDFLEVIALAIEAIDHRPCCRPGIQHLGQLAKHGLVFAVTEVNNVAHRILLLRGT